MQLFFSCGLQCSFYIESLVFLALEKTNSNDSIGERFSSEIQHFWY